MSISEFYIPYTEGDLTETSVDTSDRRLLLWIYESLVSERENGSILMIDSEKGDNY
jgi:hypothetical protein